MSTFVWVRKLLTVHDAGSRGGESRSFFCCGSQLAKCVRDVCVHIDHHILVTQSVPQPNSAEHHSSPVRMVSVQLVCKEAARTSRPLADLPICREAASSSDRWSDRVAAFEKKGGAWRGCMILDASCMHVVSHETRWRSPGSESSATTI